MGLGVLVALTGVVALAAALFSLRQNGLANKNIGALALLASVALYCAFVAVGYLSDAKPIVPQLAIIALIPATTALIFAARPQDHEPVIGWLTAGGGLVLAGSQWIAPIGSSSIGWLCLAGISTLWALVTAQTALHRLGAIVVGVGLVLSRGSNLGGIAEASPLLLVFGAILFTLHGKRSVPEPVVPTKVTERLPEATIVPDPTPKPIHLPEAEPVKLEPVEPEPEPRSDISKASPVLPRSLAFDHLGQSVIVLDEKLRIADLNSTAQIEFKISDRVIGSEITRLSFGPELCDVLDQEGEHELRYWEMGSERDLVVSIQAIVHGSTRVGAVVVLHDATERKRVERQLVRRSQELGVALVETEKMADEALSANDAKSRFLAMISHEIRTPLSGLIGMINVLQRSELDEVQRRQAAMIESSAESLLRLVGDVLDLSKAEAGRFSLESLDFDLREICQQSVEALRSMAASKGLELDLRLPAETLPTVIGDPYRLRQVLNNLLGNAIKFTEHGSVRLATEVLGREPGFIVIRLSVSDTGIGIPSDQLHTIFESYTQADPTITRRFGGTGLGLAIAKQIVETMGGRIAVKSRLGEGSTFWVELKLPTVAPQAPFESVTEPVAEPIEQENRFHGKRILVAEDDEVNVIVASSHLEFLGASYDIARNGSEAIRMAESGAYDLIFMDMYMPALSGVEATKRLRAEGYAKPIIAMTASTFESDLQESLAAGMNGRVTKPISADAIASALAAHLN